MPVVLAVREDLAVQVGLLVDEDLVCPAGRLVAQGDGEEFERQPGALLARPRPRHPAADARPQLFHRPLGRGDRLFAGAEAGRGTVLTVLTGGVILVALSFVMRWAHPGGTFASCVAIQASTSRLMFVMGRDNVLPRPVLGRPHAELLTPAPNILIVAAVALPAMNLSLADAAVDVHLITRLGSTATGLGLLWLAIGVVHLAVITKGFRRPHPNSGSTPRTPP